MSNALEVHDALHGRRAAPQVVSCRHGGSSAFEVLKLGLMDVDERLKQSVTEIREVSG
jgi:hypothetical protein